MIGIQDLTARVGREAGLSQAQARKAVDTVLRTIGEELARGEEVRLTGFGTFRVRQTAERMGRNVRTGEAIPIAAGRRPAFSPGARLAQQVRDGAGSPSAG